MLFSDLQKAINYPGLRSKDDSIAYLAHTSLEEFLDTGDIMQLTVRTRLADFDVEDQGSQEVVFDFQTKALDYM